MDSLRKPGRETPAQDPRELGEITESENIFTPRETFSSRKGGKKRSLWLIGSLLLFILLGSGSFLLYRTVTTSHTILIENGKFPSFVADAKKLARSFLSDQHGPLRGEAEGRINILLLGRAGEHYPGKNLTDTIMIASINVEERKVALLSLPRDLYAPIPETRSFTKLNSLYQYGLHQNAGSEPLRKSVENITGLPLHYFAIIDFDGFEKVVDTLGGVRVEVERDIYDTRYPGKNYSYETFELSKGWQSLDGKTALKYVRERHADPEGDFGRAKRQQQVMQALKDQAFSLSTFLNIFTIDALLTTLGESVKTDLTLEDIESLVALSRKLDTHNITTSVVDAWKKESLLRTDHVMVGPTLVFILVPRVGNFSEIHDVAENIFRLDVLAERKEYIRKEEARVLLLARPEYLTTAAKVNMFLKQELGFAEVTVQPLGNNARLENPGSESRIVDMANLEMPYSLDELLKKLPLEKADPKTLPANLPAGVAASDIIILVGESLEEVFSIEENIGREEPSLDSEAFPPQPLSRMRNME